MPGFFLPQTFKSFFRSRFQLVNRNMFKRSLLANLKIFCLNLSTADGLL